MAVVGTVVGAPQTMMQVQVPVSQNGQTVLQTVQMPVQTMAAPAAPTAARDVPAAAIAAVATAIYGRRAIGEATLCRAAGRSKAKSRRVRI